MRKGGFSKAYLRLLSSPTAPLNPQIIAMGSTLSLEQQMDLCAPFIRDNIKEALFSIPGIKSPGLDGFNINFFKATPSTNSFKLRSCLLTLGKQRLFSCLRSKTSLRPMTFDQSLAALKAPAPTLKLIMQVLTDFHVCSGLKANISKSQVIFGGCSRALQDECLKTTKFQEGSFPLRYLEVPITASKLSKSECRVLVKKIMGKVRLWSSRSLSFAGRA
ncbi:hypothetical protein Cgig2_000902 [Carnegiea gigantea]|uniref:Reverse transcriptase n=1 Tax=Carnegiea gigantea TaxID=171969 RepID=A0A9Q1GJW2_9CARY|nr:hypothetical protein Cgig2_000902 [Carnegiea gigantea]